MDVLIFYEHKARELNNACLLKVELERRGYSVKIASLYNFFIEYLIQPLYFLKPKVVIMPWLYGNSEINRVKEMFKNAEFYLINLQCEQVISQKWIDSGYFLPKGEAKDYLHICWGPKIVKRLKESGINEMNALEVGAIATDYDHDNFLKLMKTKEELATLYELDLNKKWCLFISSFTYTTMSEDEIADICERTNTEQDEFLEIMKKSKKEILKWIEELVLDNSNLEFIYRPHPNEKDDYYVTKIEEQYNNFHIIAEYSVSQWIYACDRINSWFSTSTVDAYFLKKEFVLLRPYSIPRYVDSEILLDNPCITTYEEFLSFNRGEKYILNIEFENKIKDFYTYDEDIYVYRKICDIVEELLKGSINSASLKAKKKTKIKFALSIICYFSHYVKLSKFFPIKRKILQSFEKENYKVDKYIKDYCGMLRKVL